MVESDEDVGVLVERLVDDGIRLHAVKQGIAVDDVNALTFNRAFIIQHSALFRVNEAVNFEHIEDGFFR